MIYENFRGISIDNCIGVSHVGKDTLLIAKNVSKFKFKTALDMGTGTGFIPIYLRKLGFICDGCDINKKAILCSLKNSRKNHVKINLYVSHLFKGIKKKYDVIIFNPPYGSFSCVFLNNILEIIKSFAPRESRRLSGLFFNLIKTQRKKLILKFLRDIRHHVKSSGKVFILLHISELGLIKPFHHKIIDKHNNLRLVIIKF